MAEADGEGVGGDVGSRPLVAPNEARPVAVAFPGGQFALSNIPIRVPLHFLGRDDSLAEIEAALKRISRARDLDSNHDLRSQTPRF